MENKQTDAQMVERVAREVMGFDIIRWEFHKDNITPYVVYTKEKRNGFSAESIWTPLTDANDAEMVLEKFDRYNLYKGPDGYYDFSGWLRGKEYRVGGFDKARAICEAAIKAVEGGEKI